METIEIRLSESDWRRLQQVAECKQMSPEALAQQVLSQWLQMSEEDWQKRMEQLLREFRHASQHIAPEEIEAEITSAYEEYRHQCAP